MVQQHPFAIAIGAAGQEHFESAMPCRANRPAATVAEACFHLADPLAVRRATEAEAVGELAGPVLARPAVHALAKALAPQIFLSLLAMPVVRVAPQPRGEGLVLIRRAIAASDALVNLGLRGEETLE